MENRYKLPSDIQKKYFLLVEKKSNLNVNQLANDFGVTGRTYRDWRRGKFALPQKIAYQVYERYGIPFPCSMEGAEKDWKRAKVRAAQIGGIARYSKYGRFSTPEGCAKGGHKALEILRARGVIPYAKPFFPPQDYSEELAEFVGILLGDGHIETGQWSITINSIADKQYLPYIIGLCERLFQFTPGFFHKKNCNAIAIYGGGKLNIKYLQQIGLSIGNKVKLQVGIPQWILQNKNYRTACLRGLMDTDGGVFIHKYKVNNKQYSYTKLGFTNCSIPLINFVNETLLMIKLHPKLNLSEKSKRVWLYSPEEVKQYLECVGTHNPRLLKNRITHGGVR